MAFHSGKPRKGAHLIKTDKKKAEKTAAAPPRKRRIPAALIVILVLLVLLAGGALGAVYFYPNIFPGVTVGSIYHVISERHNASRPMILSTNCSVQQLYEKYEDRIAARLCDQSRMTIIEFIGEDVRRFAR